MPSGEHFAQLWFRNRSLEVNQYNLPFFFTLSSFRKLISSTHWILRAIFWLNQFTSDCEKTSSSKKREDLFFLKKSEGKKLLAKKIIMLFPGNENHDVTTCISKFSAGRKSHGLILVCQFKRLKRACNIVFIFLCY